MSNSDAAEWQKSNASSSEAGSSEDSFHFITHCFFLTAHTLHLGVIKIIEEFEEVARGYHDLMQSGQLQSDEVRPLRRKEACRRAVATTDAAAWLQNTVLHLTQLA